MNRSRADPHARPSAAVRDARSDAPQDRGDLAEDGGVGAVDRLVRRVVGQQPDVPVLALERLDGRLALDQGGHDLAVLGGLLLAHHDVVAVADGGLDHRVTAHLEQEQRALAHELLGQREHVLERLLGQDRPAGRDPADHRDVRRLGARVADARLVVRRLRTAPRGPAEPPSPRAGTPRVPVAGWGRA